MIYHSNYYNQYDFYKYYLQALFVVYRLPVYEVLPNHEVAEFQTWLVTTSNLGYVAYFYEAIIPVPPVCPSCC